ncbi:MAG: Alkyl hydroperoxide reductase subunit C-like protein [uncultured Sulfurovum sp.]|uniref:thioredoxin-dependent peroxiredoxin n=1 Tax=uncultured Sulfurovum sp. TaxID=269237 RepID=A0A6S6TTI0_9BACT|nr:MAG: Alkyl hydroperoxide reductase subunit C-like protein [uncultured Sulfurovum sp.]
MRNIILVLCLIAFTMLQATEVASYQESFDKFMVKRSESPAKFSPKEQKVMKQESVSLAQSFPNPGIQIGGKAPEFSLTNAFGKEVNLTAELKKGPVVLVFYRGAWCPYCNMHLGVLSQSLSEFKKYDAQLIAITPQKADKSEEQIKKDAYPFEILSDVNNSVMKEYKLYFELSKELLAVYKKNGLDIEAYNGKNHTALPVPGTFVIDTQGVVRAMQAQTNYKVRMEPKDIIDALIKISKEK